MKTFKELREEVAAKSASLDRVFQEAGAELDFDQVKSLEGDTKGKVEKVQAMSRELDALHKDLEAASEMQKIATKAHQLAQYSNDPVAGIQFPGKGQGEQTEEKSLGQMLIESKGYQDWLAAKGGMPNFRFGAPVDLKTIMRTGAGWAPPEVRLPRVELSAQRPIAVANIFPQFPTSQNTIRYMKESTFTNNAAEKAETTALADADIVGESALALTETTDEVEWLPVFIPVTMQQMEDVEGLEAYVNQRLTYMLQARLDLQCIQGNGSTPNLLGINSLASVLSQALGTDSKPDAIHKAITQVRVTGMAEPSNVVIHPNDWQDIRLLTTADGIYIFGSPMDTGPDRIWGVPVLQSMAALENTVTLGDFARFAAIYNKRGVNVEVSNSHAYYFTRGLLAIRADIRVAVVAFRDTAFCKVTGM